jgi:hypothetical protein
VWEFFILPRNPCMNGMTCLGKALNVLLPHFSCAAAERTALAARRNRPRSTHRPHSPIVTRPCPLPPECGFCFASRPSSSGSIVAHARFAAVVSSLACLRQKTSSVR